MTDNKIIEFPDEATARSFVSSKQATTNNPGAPTDSSTTKVTESAEGIASKLKGLDQSGKDYGTTSKDQRVNPQHSMIGRASKEVQATAHTPDSPTDSATTKIPDSTQGIAQTLKGLDMAGKDYGQTSKEEKVNPQRGMIGTASVNEEHYKKVISSLTDRLAVTESKLLVDRAIKVGVYAEDERAEQEKVMATLYLNSRPEFNAYSMLISAQEKKAQMMPNRQVQKVASAMANRQAVLVDEANSPKFGSLENGNLFEDDTI